MIEAKIVTPEKMIVRISIEKTLEWWLDFDKAIREEGWHYTKGEVLNQIRDVVQQVNDRFLPKDD